MSRTVTVNITRVPGSPADVPLPAYATEHSAGMDLRAAVEAPLVINPGETVLVPTGIAIALPPGYEAQVRPRSGLAIKHQVGILNAPGTIDADYRGEVRVILTNFSRQPFTVKKAERIAQLVVAPYTRIAWNETASLDDTARGAGGFGHTGR